MSCLEGEDNFEDIDCKDCGLKFWVRIPSNPQERKPIPTKCPRCLKSINTPNPKG